MSSFPYAMAWADEDEEDEIEEVTVTGQRTSSGSNVCPAGFCEPYPEPGDCGGMPCGDGSGGGGGDSGDGDGDDGNDEQTDPDAADEGTASAVDLCVRGDVPDFAAISPHTLKFDDNLSGIGDMDGDGSIDTDSNGVAVLYPAEGQARRITNAAGETIRYETWLNIPVIRSVAAQTGQTVRQRITDTLTHEYVHHVNPTWSEEQVEAEGQDIYDNTTNSACGAEETDDDS